MPVFAEELGGRLPSESEKAAANQLRHETPSCGVLDEQTKEPAEITLSSIVAAPYGATSTCL